MPRWIALLAGVIGPPLFVVVSLLDSITRPHYSPVRNYVNELALGDRGWLQVANFVVTGVLMLCFAYGLLRVLPRSPRTTAGVVLVGLFGLGLVCSGVFPVDPSHGYPPGAPEGDPSHPTFVGGLHNLFGLLVFASVAAAAVVFARHPLNSSRWRGWATYSWASAFCVVLFFVASVVIGPVTSPMGFFQRLAIIVGWSWLTAFAVTVLRHSVITGDASHGFRNAMKSG